ncbi:MAG: class I SAM-dependent methyltransferase [Anaerolineae bacterium]
MKVPTIEKPARLEHTVTDQQAKFTLETKAYYTDIESYDWVDVTDNFRGLESIFHRNRERAMKRIIQRYAVPGRFLDVGTGTGLILRHLPPASVGLDINPRNMGKAKLHAPRSDLILGDAEAMPLRSNAFSTVLCTEVLEHLPNPKLAVAEIERVLTPGGVLIGSVPGRSPIWKLRFLSSTCPHDEPFHRMFRKAEVEDLLSILDLRRLSYSLLRINIVFVAHKRER